MVLRVTLPNQIEDKIMNTVNHKYTFVVELGGGKQQSCQRFDTVAKASAALASYVHVCKDNDFFVEGRVVDVTQPTIIS